MSATNRRGSTSRSRSSEASSSGGSDKPRAATSRRSTGSRSTSRRRSTSAASESSSPKGDVRRNSGGDGRGSRSAVRGAITNVLVPMASAAAGVAGGVVLGRTALQRNRKILGIAVPGSKIGLSDMSKQIGEAGRQFGRLAGEVRAAREKAEKISRAIN